MTIEAMRRRRGLPLVVCAPSGTGKTTLIKKLREEFPLNFSVSCTTRPPRPGEMDGRDYVFLDRAAFLEKDARAILPSGPKCTAIFTARLCSLCLNA